MCVRGTCVRGVSRVCVVCHVCSWCVCHDCVRGERGIHVRFVCS